MLSFTYFSNDQMHEEDFSLVCSSFLPQQPFELPPLPPFGWACWPLLERTTLIAVTCYFWIIGAHLSKVCEYCLVRSFSATVCGPHKNIYSNRYMKSTTQDLQKASITDLKLQQFGCYLQKKNSSGLFMKIMYSNQLELSMKWFMHLC